MRHSKGESLDSRACRCTLRGSSAPLPMSRSLRWLLPALVAVAVALPCSAQGASRLSPTAARVLADGSRTDKVDGGEVTYRTTLVYDPADGTYTHILTDASGIVVETSLLEAPMVRPSADEEAAVQEMIASDPELSALIAEAAARPGREVVVSGGFPLIREAGHPCDATARCVQYDIFSPRIVGARGADRVRYVVVDLRTMTIVSRDFDAANEGNLANPAIREESRSR